MVWQRNNTVENVPITLFSSSIAEVQFSVRLYGVLKESMSIHREMAAASVQPKKILVKAIKPLNADSKPNASPFRIRITFLADANPI
jgi:hypothetical protein